MSKVRKNNWHSFGKSQSLPLFSDGSKKGDNFACVMKLVTVNAEVEGEKKALEYMAKCFPMNEARTKWLVEVIAYMCHAKDKANRFSNSALGH